MVYLDGVLFNILSGEFDVMFLVMFLKVLVLGKLFNDVIEK